MTVLSFTGKIALDYDVFDNSSELSGSRYYTRLGEILDCAHTRFVSSRLYNYMAKMCAF